MPTARRVVPASMSVSAAGAAREADLCIGPLRLWIDGRQPSDVEDYWDGNWLIIQAQCASAHSQVRIAGPLLHLSEIVTLHSGCAKLDGGQVQEAGLYCMQPNLKIELWAVPGDQLIGKIRITPDHKAELHDFGFALERDALQAVIVACAHILREFPLRHAPSREKD